MDNLFHPALYNGCNYLSMVWLKLIHVSKRAPSAFSYLHPGSISLSIMELIIPSKFHPCWPSSKYQSNDCYENLHMALCQHGFSSFLNARNHLHQVQVKAIKNTDPKHFCKTDVCVKGGGVETFKPSEIRYQNKIPFGPRVNLCHIEGTSHGTWLHLSSFNNFTKWLQYQCQSIEISL